MRLFGYQLDRKHTHMQKSLAGFTLVEVIVVVAVVGFISAQIFASFSGLNQASIFKRSAQELSFNIRRAQNMALAVAPVAIGGSLTIPQSVGIRITSSLNDDDGDGVSDNKEYFFFSDQNANGKYDGPGERIEPSIFLPGGMRITSITGSVFANQACHIIFYTPEARVALTQYNGNSVGNFMNVTLTAPSGDTITVRTLVSGQVSVFEP